MSFKRDGSDSGMLSVLQKRRIKDILAEGIPEDEAKLLSNGRFTCLVCNSNPIFDTVDMLCVHRKGKKHKSSAEHFERKKEEIKQLIAKRRHEQFVKTGSASISMAQSHHTGISTSSPYDPRVRKNSKMKFGNRRQRVDLTQSTNADVETETNTNAFPSSLGLHNAPELKNDNRCPSSSTTTPWQQICEQQIHNGAVRHSSQLKNIFHRRNNDEPVRLHPYTSKHRPTLTLKKSVKEVSNPNSIKDSCTRHSISPNIDPHQQSSHSQSRNHPNILHPPLPLSTTNNTYTTQILSMVLPPPPPPPPLPPPSNAEDSSPVPQPQLLQSQNRQLMTKSAQKSLTLKYHNLQGSGWKRDWDGKWIKDDDAEFDSDEEPPDIP